MTTVPGKHLFLVGTGRCGSSISYSCLAMHPDFAWLSSWLTVAPRVPALSLANRAWNLPGTDRFREARFVPKPSEPNVVFERWDQRFRIEDADAPTVASARQGLAPLVERICRLHGRPRFLCKIVGRPVKVATLATVFPEATFIHVTRALRPSVASLLQVEFYDESALQRWPWRAVPPAYLELWERRGRPRELAAAILVQANLLELDRQLARVARGRWIELGYADFVTDPVAWIRAAGAHAGFAVPDAFVARVRRRGVYGGADDKWRRQFTPQQMRHIEEFEALPAAGA